MTKESGSQEHRAFEEGENRREQFDATSTTARTPGREIVDNPKAPATLNLSRTKPLLLAAIRLWELKRGIRD